MRAFEHAMPSSCRRVTACNLRQISRQLDMQCSASTVMLRCWHCGGKLSHGQILRAAVKGGPISVRKVKVGFPRGIDDCACERGVGDSCLLGRNRSRYIQ